MQRNENASIKDTKKWKNSRKRLQRLIKKHRIELKKIDLKLIKLRDADR